jgi:AcrR family transcriptional regulator
MRNLIRKTFRGAKRRIKAGLRDGRTYALYDAAQRLLAHRDYESVSIIDIVKEAGCSVGAFYGRFHDKDSFLYTVISASFKNTIEKAKHDLDPYRWRRASTEKIVEQIVRHVVSQTSCRPAGVTRAALKLARTSPHVLEPMQEYREAVMSLAETLLAARAEVAAPARSVREATQMAMATASDALLQDGGPLRAGYSRGMSRALGDLLIRYLGIDGTVRIAEIKDDEPDEKASKPIERRSKDGKLIPVIDVEAPGALRRGRSEGKKRRRISQVPYPKVHTYADSSGRSAEDSKRAPVVNPKRISRSKSGKADGEGSTEKRPGRIILI